MPDEKNILDEALDILDGALDVFDGVPDKAEREAKSPTVIDVKAACQLCDGEKYFQEDDGSFQPCPLCNRTKIRSQRKLDSGDGP